MDPILLITVISTGIIAAVLLISYVCYSMAFKAEKEERDPHAPIKLAGYAEVRDRMDALITELESTPYEPITITSHDGLSLTARYYHYAVGAPVEIQMHGYRGHALRDFCSGARDARDRGHNLILVNQRSHGGSGKCITFGVKERYDCHSWVSYAVERFGEDVKIILIGISMGAATVLMASELDLPKNVKCIMADCPYSSPKAIIKKVIGDMKLPAAVAFPLVRLGGLIFGGFDVCAASAVEAVKNTDIPILLIHGEGDSFVPCYMSEEIYAASDKSRTRLVTFPGAEHGLSYFSDTDGYLGEVVAHMTRSLEN